MLPMSRVCHNRSFLSISTLKNTTCVMALLVPTRLKFNPSPVEVANGVLNGNRRPSTIVASLVRRMVAETELNAQVSPC